MNAETFTVQAHEGHTTDLARLQSTRFALMSETEQGRRWAEAKLKRVTGGGTITARYMRQDNFEFFPKFKVVVEGNHKPKLWSVDEAIRRRLRLVPFDIVIPEKERDTEIAEKLKKEWPGILRWMIEGCLKWQRDGLKMPEVVRCATEVYLKEQDVFAQWIAMECEVAARERMPAPAGYDSWKSYALAGKEWPGKRHEFKEKMEKAGFSWGHFRDGDYFSGIKLKDKTKGSGYVFVREDEWNKMKEEANKGQ